MSASKLALCGIGTALFRIFPRTRTVTTNSPYLFFKPFPPLRRHASSSSAAVAEETVSSVDQHHHPWPEWISFVDRLTTKGYISKPSSSSDDSVYANVNLLKDACLSFARDRYDLFKLLPSEDIQAVVEGGCPNLLRKAVNSAKRLRAQLRLDEGDVCSACNLRGSCDRAYVILKEFEADARTVDIVRILLFYAIDPLVLSAGEKPPGREVVESSVRKLLAQLIELSESSPAPAPVPAHSKPAAQDAVGKARPKSFRTNGLSKDVEMKKGDWMCPKCNFMNFSRNMQCRTCKEDRPKDLDLPTIEMKQGDWICTECNFINFSRNIKCRKCQTEGPKRANTNEVQMKKGDWTCPQNEVLAFGGCGGHINYDFNRLTHALKCGYINYASNIKCLQCPEPRPKKNPGDWSCPKCEFMNFASKVKCFRCLEPNPNPKKYPGDWNCPKCDFYNYARNTACLKCNTKHSKEQPTSEYEEHIWRRPN